MAKGKFVLAATAIAAVSLSALAGTSQAVTYTESPGDAGQTLATARPTGTTAGLPLTSISGTIGTSIDADLFKFSVTGNNTAFSASTVGGSTLDTALFLFDGTGKALFTNDDASGGLSLESTLSATLNIGTYYLGISLSGNEPVNTANQLLFNPYTGGDSSSTRGAAPGLNPATEATFNGNTSFAETGPYSIALTGAATAVPEPSTWAVVGASAAALAFLRRRRIA